MGHLNVARIEVPTVTSRHYKEQVLKRVTKDILRKTFIIHNGIHP